MLTYHRKYLGFWYIALDKVTNSSATLHAQSKSRVIFGLWALSWCGFRCVLWGCLL